MQALFLTSQRLITQHWPAASALLAPVLDAARGEFTLDDLEELARDGRAVLGVAFEGDAPVMAMAFQFRHYPRCMAVNVMALGGRDMHAIASTFWPQFVAWAQESGASHIEACTSPAMARMLRPLGFSKTYELVRTPCH